MRWILVLGCCLLGATELNAQRSPYAEDVDRTIKALSAEEIDGLLGGAGLGYARAAELNGIPGPRHVLDMADSLQVDPPQRAAIQHVFDRMQQQAMALGRRIVEAERDLDLLFASGNATPASINSHVDWISRLEAKLRTVHLNAHLETAALLKDPQIHRYNVLRGYAGDAAGHEHEAGAGHEH